MTHTQTHLSTVTWRSTATVNVHLNCTDTDANPLWSLLHDSRETVEALVGHSESTSSVSDTPHLFVLFNDSFLSLCVLFVFIVFCLNVVYFHTHPPLTHSFVLSLSVFPFSLLFLPSFSLHSSSLLILYCVSSPFSLSFSSFSLPILSLFPLPSI